MNKPSDRLVNIFGALALGVADRVRWAALDESGLGGEGAAALVVIGHQPGLSIDQLSRVLGLSHAGTVRLVDRLEAAHLAFRRVADHDRRALTLKLTEEGLKRREALLERRREVLGGMLKEVAGADFAMLERAFDAILQKLPNDAISALTVCRFCNEQRCAQCPMDSFGSVS